MVQSYPMSSSQLGSATIRALSSLSRRDAEIVRATVRAAASCHHVQEHDDYDGYLSLLITPTDEVRPSFMVAGRSGAVDVAELWGDEMMTIGTFASIGAAMVVLRPALERREPAAGLKANTEATALIGRYGESANLHVALQADAQPDQDRWTAILRALDQRSEPS